jgi:hypothetical protein
VPFVVLREGADIGHVTIASLMFTVPRMIAASDDEKSNEDSQPTCT